MKEVTEIESDPVLSLQAELLRRLEEGWQIQEQPFRSRVRVVGPLVAAFRSAWNSISTKWYVRPLLAQQEAYNRLVGSVLRQQAQQIEDILRLLEELRRQSELHGQLLVDRELSIAALAEQAARLEVQLQQGQESQDLSCDS